MSLYSCTEKVPNKELKLPAIIGSKMVLQQQTDAVLWGWTKPYQKVTVECSWHATADAIADSTGKWSLKVKTPEASFTPQTVKFSVSDTTLVCDSVLIGEVWVCSGQSNMEMPMVGWPPQLIENADTEIAAANFSNLRLFTVQRKFAAVPQTDCIGNWDVCSPTTVANFSSTAYFFGRKLLNELNIPIGLIHTSWGGTPAEAWTAKGDIAQLDDYKMVANYDMTKYEKDLDLWHSSMIKKPIDFNADNNSWKNTTENDALITNLKFDDSNWATMNLPKQWEQDSIGPFNGIVWFRKKIAIPTAWVGKDLVVTLGKIDDADVSYFNGKEVGSVYSWTEKRVYDVPANLVSADTCVIVVKVFDNMGGGGITGDVSELSLALKSDPTKPISLAGVWAYSPVAEYLNNALYFFTEKSNITNMPKSEIGYSEYTPTMLYNGMLAPIIPFTMRGVIWYQGEANVHKAQQYRVLFPKMIESWRNAWQQGDFPFYYVQIAPWNYSETQISASAELRDAQLSAMNLPNVGMVVTMDIGCIEYIHPPKKKHVGERLAAWALAKNYSKSGVAYSGPIYKSMKIEDNKIRVQFDYAEKGLLAKGDKLTDFEIAGEDQIYVPASAVIDGNDVIVSSPTVATPVAVRFAWRDISQPNLFNNDSLPASPFRTDNWTRLTDGVK